MDTLRQRKKRQTHSAIIKSAAWLFAKHGYAQTTISDIARHAKCSPRTFFQYFESKESLLLVGLETFWDSYEQALSDRPPGMSALQATDLWARTTAQQLLSDESQLDVNHEILHRNIGVQRRGKSYSQRRMEQALAPELAKDFGSDKFLAEAKMLATAAGALFSTYHTDPLIAQSARDVFLDKAIAMLQGAFTAIQAKSVISKR